MEANRSSSGYELKSELARHCLPPANRDASRKLAWINSICILFLLVGVLGAKQMRMSVQPRPVVEEVIPTFVEPPQSSPTAIEIHKPDQPVPNKPDTANVIVVTSEAPSISFSVPTMGPLVVPAIMAKAPPLNPLQSAAPVKNESITLGDTGVGGERPKPPYPRIAQDRGIQGTVLLALSVDESGAITSIVVRSSSGYPFLDRNTLDFVKRRWILPPGIAGRKYEVPIRFIFKLEP